MAARIQNATSQPDITAGVQRSGVPFDCVPGFGLPADASQGW